MLLILKLLVAPGLVAAVTLAVRRWGPGIGGWLSGMPVVAGPVLIFIAIEQGAAFGAQAAHATLAGLIGTAAFTVMYARSAVRLTWWGSLLVGWATFAATTSVLYVLAPSLVASFACLFLATLVGRWALPAVAVSAGGAESPRGDLPWRLLATATLVLALTAVADRLGPRLSGLLNAFPVLTTIITAFTHAQRGAGATIAFVRAFVRSIIGFGAFCFALALALNRMGMVRALLLALAVQVMVSGLTLRTFRAARLAES
jgi:uncharacterized membrane protein (GlpM family)